MNQTDRHYSPEEWADFARHVTPPETRSAMRAHLDAGCPACAELHDTLAAVHGIAAADALNEPPAATLRLARAMYGARPAEDAPFARAAGAVRLLFDSALLTATVGLRNVPSGPRKFLFASGDMVIDLQLTPTPRRTVLIGQVTMPSHVDRRIAGLPALLHRGTERVARATTNDLGEFEMEFEGPAEDLSLALGSESDPTVISLGTFARTHP